MPKLSLIDGAMFYKLIYNCWNLQSLFVVFSLSFWTIRRPRRPQRQRFLQTFSISQNGFIFLFKGPFLVFLPFISILFCLKRPFSFTQLTSLSPRLINSPFHSFSFVFISVLSYCNSISFISRPSLSFIFFCSNFPFSSFLVFLSFANETVLQNKQNRHLRLSLAHSFTSVPLIPE